MTSKRFLTTSRTDLDYVASRRHEVEDRPTMSRKLKERKIANTKTSIAFGNDKLDYSTESSKCQSTIHSHPHPSSFTSHHNNNNNNITNQTKNPTSHELKAHLTKTNFTLGSPTSICSSCRGCCSCRYTPSSLLPDPTGSVSFFRGTLPTDVKNAIKQSSIRFGDDDDSSSKSNANHYVSVARSAAAAPFRNGLTTTRSIEEEFDTTKRLTEELRRRHRSHNVTFGGTTKNTRTDDEDRASCYQSGYREYNENERRSARGYLSDETMKDLKGCHFDLGTYHHSSSLHHSSSALAAQDDGRSNNIVITTHSAAVHNLENLKGWNRKREMEKRAMMTNELKKTNFVLGPDPEYV